MILSYIQRPDITKKTYAETFIGVGGNARMLKNYPVNVVSCVTVGPVAVHPTTSLESPGYWLDSPDDPPGRPQAVNLRGYAFRRGATATIDYTAGYYVSAEPQTAAALVPVDAQYGAWAEDEGVTYANGTVLTPVTANPAQGQYKLAAQPGEYIFNSADFGQAVLISYSFTPADLEQACIEMISERYKYRDRIGLRSKSLGGQETTSYNLSAMPEYVKTILNPYKRIVPL